MVRHKYFIIGILIILLGSMVALYILLNKRGTCSRITCISFIEKGKYVPGEIYEETAGVFRAIFRHDQTMLRVDIRSKISASDADMLMNGFLAQIKGLYANTRSPYPGDVSNEIVCSKEFIPQFSADTVNGVNIMHFSAYLTSRLTYGACVADLTSYRDTTAIFYCPNRQQLITLEWIVPKEQAPSLLNESTIVQSIRCD